MTRRIVALFLGAAFVYACDFGASKIEVRPFDENGDGDGDGDGDLGGDAGDGDGAGGSGDGDGSGGGDGDGTGGMSGTTYSCGPLDATPTTLLSDTDLAGQIWQGRKPFLTPIGSNDVLVALEYEKVKEMPEDPFQSTLALRMVSDSMSNPLGALLMYEPTTPGTRNLSGVHFGGGVLTMVAVADPGLVNITIPIINGNSFGTPMEMTMPVPGDCIEQTAEYSAHIERVFVDFDAMPFSLALTCRRTDNTDPENPIEQAKSFVHLEGDWKIVVDWVADASGRARQYADVGGLHVLFLGEDVGAISYRVGQTQAELQGQDYPFALDPNRLTSVGFMEYEGNTGLFFMGAAFTGPADNPAIVPATVYAGGVNKENLTTFADTTPPMGLFPGREYTSAFDAVQYEVNYRQAGFFYAVGTTLSPPDSVLLSMFEPSGKALVADYVISHEEGADMGEVTPAVVKLGLGLTGVYSQDSELLAKRFLCAPDE